MIYVFRNDPNEKIPTAKITTVKTEENLTLDLFITWFNKNINPKPEAIWTAGIITAVLLAAYPTPVASDAGIGEITIQNKVIKPALRQLLLNKENKNIKIKGASNQ